MGNAYCGAVGKNSEKPRLLPVLKKPPPGPPKPLPGQLKTDNNEQNKNKN